MGHLTLNKRMNTQSPDNWFELVKWVIVTVLAIIPIWKYIDKYFEYKKSLNEKFIKDVVINTMDICLKEFKEDFNEFKRETHLQINTFNATVIELYKEVRK